MSITKSELAKLLDVSEDNLRRVKDYNRNPYEYYYNVNCSVRISKNLVKFGELSISFNRIDGDFFCDNVNLFSLEGSPQIVTGDFYCNMNKLRSLEGGPVYVGGLFNCQNNLLTTLIGGPKRVGKSYVCVGNELTDLCGVPDIINGVFNCCRNKLTNLDTGPKMVTSKYFAFRNNLIEINKNINSNSGVLLAHNKIKNIADGVNIDNMNLYKYNINYFKKFNYEYN